VEKQSLAQRRQADVEDLARQQMLARADRERRALEAQLEHIVTQRRIVQEQAMVEDERLGRLEERLRHHPLAAQWEWEGAQLEVARALAGNTRAILQVGNAGDIARALVMREGLLEPREPGPGAGVDSVAKSIPPAPTWQERLHLPDFPELTHTVAHQDDAVRQAR
jgi:hypothetical protein